MYIHSAGMGFPYMETLDNMALGNILEVLLLIPLVLQVVRRMDDMGHRLVAGNTIADFGMVS